MLTFPAPSYELAGVIYAPQTPVTLTSTSATTLPVTVTAPEPQRLLVKVRGYGPRNAVKRMQMLVSRFAFDYKASGAITLRSADDNTTAMTFNAGSSAQYEYNGNDNSGGDGVFNGGDFRVIRRHGVIQSAETQAHHVHPVRYRRIYGCDYRRRGSGVVDPGCPEDFVISEKRAGSHTGYGGERRRYLVPSRFGRDKGPVPDLVRSIAHRLRMREKVYVIASHDHFAIRESRLPFRISGGGRQGTACEHRMREIDAGVYDPYLRAASGLRSSSCFVRSEGRRRRRAPIFAAGKSKPFPRRACDARDCSAPSERERSPRS